MSLHPVSKQVQKYASAHEEGTDQPERKQTSFHAVQPSFVAAGFISEINEMAFDLIKLDHGRHRILGKLVQALTEVRIHEASKSTFVHLSGVKKTGAVGRRD